MTSTFIERLNDGRHGEVCVSRGLDTQVIENEGWGWGPQVTETEWNDERLCQIASNKVEGDLWFIYKGVRYVVDAKNGVWVSEDSIENFTLYNSYYFFNAHTVDFGYKYLMVRADLRLRVHLMQDCERHVIVDKSTGKERPGRIIDFNKLPSRYVSSTLMVFPFDPKMYLKIVADNYDYCRENNIPYVKRIISF